MSTPTGCQVTRSGDTCVTPWVTRSKSVTLAYRQRSGKRVICVTRVEKVTRPRFVVVARAHVRARKDINRSTRHHASPGGAR